MICGALAASLVLCGSGVAFAKVANMSIPVSYNNIKVMVDGKELQTSKEPFTYDGTTYLPIRAVAEAVGMDVTWDSATKTAILSSKPDVAEVVEAEELAKEEPVEEEKKSERIGKILSKNEVNAGSARIIFKGAEEVNDLFGGIQLNFKMKNPSSQNYSITANNVKINGMKVDSGIYTSLNNDRDVEDNIRVYEKYLEEAGITQLKKIEIEFSIWNKDTYDHYEKDMTIDFKY